MIEGQVFVFASGKTLPGMLPNVKITAINELKGNTLTTLTNENGMFVIQFLEPSTYTIIASKEGYIDAKISGFPLRLYKINKITPLVLRPLPKTGQIR